MGIIFWETTKIFIVLQCESRLDLSPIENAWEWQKISPTVECFQVKWSKKEATPNQTQEMLWSQCRPFQCHQTAQHLWCSEAVCQKGHCIKRRNGEGRLDLCEEKAFAVQRQRQDFCDWCQVGNCAWKGRNGTRWLQNHEIYWKAHLVRKKLCQIKLIQNIIVWWLLINLFYFGQTPQRTNILWY